MATWEIEWMRQRGAETVEAERFVDSGDWIDFVVRDATQPGETAVVLRVRAAQVERIERVGED